MKEDILEQLTQGYLESLGYFTMLNVKFKPGGEDPEFVQNQDSVHSDIDILAINPLCQDHRRVIAVSCKSWQTGFHPESEIRAIQSNKQVSGREAWRRFRELTKDKWARAFKERIQALTGHAEFVHMTAVTICKGNKKSWTENDEFRGRLTPHIEIIELNDMLSSIVKDLNGTVASSDLGRMLQLLKASGFISMRDLTRSNIDTPSAV